MLAEVGEGGFGAQDFELTQQLGALSWVSHPASCITTCLSPVEIHVKADP